MIKKFTRLMLAVSMIGLSFGSMAQATDLFISEYAEGSSNNKYLEIYNATGVTVDLSNYEIWRISNGGSWPESITSLTGMLNDGDLIVIANSSADPTITNLANATIAFNSATFFNGDDAMGLAKNDGTGTFLLIDAVGTSGPDPGSGWDVAGTTNGTANHTLVRKATVCSPDTTWTTTSGTTTANSQWDVFPSDTWTDAGMHTSTCAPVSTSNDSIKPEIANGTFLSATSVVITFSEPVTMVTATDISNYTIAPGVSVTAASQSASLDVVTLTLSSALMNMSMYTVDIVNVTDTSGNANVMDPFNTSFYYNSYNGSDIIVTEIMYAQNSGGVQDIDYFEIHNMGTAAVFLGGMALSSGMDLEIDSNLTLAAGAYLVITEDVDSFMVAFPAVTNVIGVDGGSLSGGGETIEMVNSLDEVVTSVTYDNGAPFPGYTDLESIELCDLSTDYTMGENWYYAGSVSSTVANTIYGTPGSANSCAALPVIATYAIEDVRTVDANFELDSLGVYCALEGLVYGKDLFGGGYSFTIHDGTAGINVIAFNNIGSFTVNQGDEVRVVGTIDQYNGFAQIQIDSVSVISTGNCIDYPTPTFELSEETESEPISLFQVRLADPSAWPNAGSNANLDIITMNGDTLTMRIDKDTEIADSITSGPSGLFNLSGTGGQFDGSAPYDEGYQIFPMFVSDFDTVPSTVSDLFINEVMVDNQTVVADAQGDFDSWIEIYNANATPIDLTGMLFGTDEPFYFSRCQAPVVVPAMGFAILWADGEVEDGAGHLPLELLDADFLGFATKDLTILDTLEWDSSLTDVSLGRSIDGAGTWVSFEVSTPNASNSTGIILSVINALEANPLNVYPNPASNGNINFNKVVSFTMYSITGQTVMIQNNINRLDVSNLENGIYIIETTEGEVVKVIVN
ncbi:MAG: hypothetical protein ACI85Q_000095 [Salibacteraceae bacterium]|jgi:hypothetical protein